MHIWKINEINDLAALPFLQQAAAAKAGLVAPQHGFCVQVKPHGEVFAEPVS